MMKTYAWLTALILLVLTGTLSAQPGVTVDYCTYLGGTQYDMVWASVVDDSKLILGGYASSYEYPTTPGVWRETLPTSLYGDGAVTILDVDSHALVASTYLGGNMHDVVYSVCTDEAGNIYAAGQTSSTNLPATNGAYQQDLVSDMAGYVASFSGDLTHLRWLSYVDTPISGYYDDDQVQAIVHSPDGYLYISGYLWAPGGITWSRQLADTLGNCYLMKLDDTDGSLVWNINMGTMMVHSMDILPEGDIVVGGGSSGNVPVSENAFQDTCHGQSNHYIAAIHDDGSFSWGTFIGGSGIDQQLSIKALNSGRVVFAGMTRSQDYPSTTTEWGMNWHGDFDIVAGVLSGNGQLLDWCGYLGGYGKDGYLSGHGVGLSVDDGGHLYIFTSTESSDLPVTAGAYQPQQEGTRLNGMMASLDVDDGTLRWLSYFGGPELIIGTSAAVYPGGMAVMGEAVTWDGATHGLPVTPDALSDTLAGPTDGFVALLEMDDIVPTQLQSADLAWEAGSAVLRWRLAGDAAPLRAEVVTAAGLRELPVQQEPDGAWTARDERACAEGAAPRTYRLVLPGENRWTVLWRREVTPECAAAGTLRLAGRLLGGGAVELRLRSPQAGAARLAIYDLSGRRVATLPERTVPIGESVWEWDGRTEAGARAPAGRYLARCTVGGRVVTAAVTLVR